MRHVLWLTYLLMWLDVKYPSLINVAVIVARKYGQKKDILYVLPHLCFACVCISLLTSCWVLCVFISDLLTCFKPLWPLRLQCLFSIVNFSRPQSKSEPYSSVSPINNKKLKLSCILFCPDCLLSTLASYCDKHFHIQFGSVRGVHPFSPHVICQIIDV